MKTDKLGIYVDTHNLRRELYKAMMEMTKAHRVIIGDKMIQRSGEMISHIAMANNLLDSRLKYIDTFIAEFEALKDDLRICMEDSIITNDYTKLRIFEIVAKIDEGVGKWRNYTLSRHEQAQNACQSDAIKRSGGCHLQQ